MNRIFIDVREPFEYAMGHVVGSVNMPPSRLMSGAPELADVPKDTELVLYCNSGSRSNVATHYLRDMGYHNVTNGINKMQVAHNYGVELE